MPNVAGTHSAEASALGFYYQSLYALLALLESKKDDASIAVEHLDDIQLVASGESLLSQLKHSMAQQPASLTISSPNLWRTLKAWIDVLSKVVIEETTFQLIAVSPLPTSSPLTPLTKLQADRNLVREALSAEAARVVLENQNAKASGITPLPHAGRVKDCKAFLDLPLETKTSLINRIIILPCSTNIAGIPKLVAEQLRNFPPAMRDGLAGRLIEWWDLQILFSLCGKRERFLAAIEVQQKTSELAGEIERDELSADFLAVTHPDEHTPDSMLVKQIELVGGTASDLNMAVREEWRARSQRHKWATDRLDMATEIDRYDAVLTEAWSDKHQRMIEDCNELPEVEKCSRGHQLLRWSLDKAHTEVPNFGPRWATTYYVRGSFQILAIDLQVGWHPEYRIRLGGGA
jgi:hypothetical protein